nr:ribonuclease H-like domain-containing protein [Tanacetum cinerariifolium]
MVTRYHVGSNCPTQRLSLHVSLVSPLPKSYRVAFNDSNWQNVICDEYHAFIKNKTWTLVPRPTDTNIVRCMWLFRHKYHEDGTLSRYKARLVANGSTQLEGVDVDETFSPVVKLGTFGLFSHVIGSIHQEFSMTDLGSLNYFMGIFVMRDSTGMFLSQRKYAVEILERLIWLLVTPVGLLLILSPNWVMTVIRFLTLPLKRILRYVPGTLDYGLQLFSSSTQIWLLIRMLIGLDVLLRRSTSGYRVFLETTYSSSPLSVNQRFLVRVLRPSIVVLPMLLPKLVRVLHVPSRYQYADIFIKSLSSVLFEEFRTSLSVRCPPASTAGEC